jgi:putative transposase
MPRGLKRFYGAGDLHFITFSCYRRRKFLSSPARRDLFLQAFENVRQEYELLVVGFVIMPEHVHLLIGEPRKHNLSVAIKALKQSVSLTVFNHVRKENPAANIPEHFWQKRFYDFNVFTEKKRIEKLRYMHRNPVKRGLVTSPEQWRWSSFRDYAYREKGPVTVNAIFPPDWATNLKVAK